MPDRHALLAQHAYCIVELVQLRVRSRVVHSRSQPTNETLPVSHAAWEVTGRCGPSAVHLTGATGATR
ncbi:MAG: hypothetical protein QOF35_593 [Actinomycetota bacterium]|nr:hypothetical protein [Actinomycetota bacterium]